MKLLVLGRETKQQELQARLGDSHEYMMMNPGDDNVELDFNGIDMVFDLDFQKHPDRYFQYANQAELPVFVHSTGIQISRLINDTATKPDCLLIGMNAMSTFINREVMECMVTPGTNLEKVKALGNELGWEISLVEDRVGMVTPRIVLMIINEACYTVQEGTAGIEDIDLGMKLGTNYPKGPFEWADAIGIEEVYENLLAISEDTGDQRYKIAPFLKTKYLRKEKFHQTAKVDTVSPKS